MSLNWNNNILRKPLVNLFIFNRNLSIIKILLLNIEGLNWIINLINRMWFIYNLHFNIFLVSRSHDFLRRLASLFLGCLIGRSLIIACFLPFLFILSCMWGDLIRLRLDYWLLTALFFFFICYFSDRLRLFDVGQFEIVLNTRVCRLRLSLLRMSISVNLIVLLTLTHLFALTLL
jgi:hypothetical protein